MWWLGKRLTKRRAGDRLWMYFAGAEKKIAAMTLVNSAPHPSPAGSDKPYHVTTALGPAATAALHNAPVRLTEMEQHPQACGQMRVADAKLAATRAGL